MGTGAAGAGRVLIIEDDPGAGRAMLRLLRAYGHAAELTGTLATGREALGRGGVDRLVLDLMLPDGDGAEMLRELRAAGSPVRVCVCSGVSDAARLAAVRALRPDAILPKPIDVPKLLKWLAEAVRSPAVST